MTKNESQLITKFYAACDANDAIEALHIATLLTDISDDYQSLLDEATDLF